METLDKKQLLNHLEHVESVYASSASDFDHGVFWIVKNIQKHIRDGQFDIQEEKPKSTLQIGDKVTHRKHKYLGTGIIIQLSKSGKTASVDFSQIDDWDHKRLSYPPRSFYYPVEYLILVEEQTDGT